MKKLMHAVGILLVVGLAVIFLDVGCIFRYTLGFPCPGCGTTRAWFCMLEGHLVDAFYWHPLFWLTVPLLLLVLIKQQQVFRSAKANKIFWFTIFAMYLSVYIVRMILLFPDTPPMDYNEQSIFYRIYQYLQEHPELFSKN